MLRPLLVTFTSHDDHPGFLKLERSAEFWGWPLHVIHEPWRGFGYRLRRSLLEIPSAKDMGYSHLISVDAWDSLVNAPVEEFDKIEQQTGRSTNGVALTFAAEPALWPPNSEFQNHYEGRTSHWWYAHSQFCIDLSKPLPYGFGDMEYGDDDQTHAHIMFIRHQRSVMLDRGCRVFQSIAHCNPYEDFFSVEKLFDRDNLRGEDHFMGLQVHNKVLGTVPLILHANGQTTCSWWPENKR